VILVGFGSSLVARFVASLDRAKAQSRELEQRVQAKSDELARNYERLRDLERQRTIASERERIMREMHDGLGGHLVSTLARVEGRSATLEDAADGLRMALADMRVVIDSLDPGLPDLAALLGVFRGRMGPLLEDAGIDFSWRSELSAREFGPETSLQVLRILQEIFTNAVRHAQARSIRLEAREEPGHVTIDVRDDGHGFDPAPARGRGLANIKHRANQIGAELQVSSDASGTRILLSLPLSADDPNRRDR
jgi:signal transduction histidine kinase